MCVAVFLHAHKTDQNSKLTMNTIFNHCFLFEIEPNVYLKKKSNIALHIHILWRFKRAFLDNDNNVLLSTEDDFHRGKLSNEIDC